MHIQRLEYLSPVDALVAIAKRLNRYEERYHRSSEEFYRQYRNGLLDDAEEFVEWSGDYQHYLALRLDIEQQLRYAA